MEGFQCSACLGGTVSTWGRVGEKKHKQICRGKEGGLLSCRQLGAKDVEITLP